MSDLTLPARGVLLVALLLVALDAAGCATAATTRTETAPAIAAATTGTETAPSVAAATTDGLLLVFFREMSFERDVEDINDEARILECVASGVLSKRFEQRLISFDAFRRLAFPDLAPEAVPRDPKYLRILLDSPRFQKRIAPLRLRYLAVVGGVTRTGESEGGTVCGAAPGAVGCFGFESWERRTRLGAVMLDRMTTGRDEKMVAVATGRSWMAIILILPVGQFAATEDSACFALGEQIAEYLNAKHGAETTTLPAPAEVESSQ